MPSTQIQRRLLGVGMKKHAANLILLLLGLSILNPASLGEEGKTSYTCPACGNQFEGPVPSKESFEVQLSDGKSTDSDFCHYSEGESPMLRMVATCPKCMYSAFGKGFSMPLRDGQKSEIRTMLEKYPPPSVKEEGIPAWMSWQYAARCYNVVRKDVLFAGQAFHGGAYCARIEATALATVKLAIENPESVLPQLEEVEKKIAAENDKQKKMELMMVAAQAAHRGGFIETRDKWVAQLQKQASADDAAKKQIKKFTELVAAEEQCLEEALTCYQTAMENALVSKRNRPLYNYLIADIMRRLGRRRSPVVGSYARVIEDEAARSDLKRLANYFVEYLSR